MGITSSPRTGAIPAELPAWQDPSSQPYVRIERLTKQYGDLYAVDDVSLEIYQGEFFSLLGGSGCGKTTLLRLVAGLEPPTAGRIFIDGTDVTELPPYRRPVNLMFQSYALFPHLSVTENIEFGLQQERLPRRERQRRVAEMLELLRIPDLGRRRPQQLSGGERQRVALARCLVKHPKLLLLDEPLGALDKRLREHTQFELVNLQEALGITFVTVTHDQEEAMTMSSRIAVMEAGRILQVDTPAGVYEYPNCRRVAEFIGSVNLFRGKVLEQHNGEVLVQSELGRTLRVPCPQPLARGTPVAVAVRPEKLRLCQDLGEEATNRLRGVVEDIAYTGNLSIYHVRVSPAQVVQITLANTQPRSEQRLTWDDPVILDWAPASGVLLTD